MSSSTLRRTRIGLLKATHAPIVLAINLFEGISEHLQDPSSFPHTPIAGGPAAPPHSGGIGEATGDPTSGGTGTAEPAYKGKAKKKFLTSRTGTSHSLHFMDKPSIARDGEASPLVSGRWDGPVRGRKEMMSDQHASANCGNARNGNGKGCELNGKSASKGEEGRGSGEDANGDQRRGGEREHKLERKIDELTRKVEELTRLFVADKGLGAGAGAGGDDYDDDEL
ncbi:hypothetical protein EYC84_000606 [Monilinia fructicola]|nr:hypothetical protein EYC84_000606 [Monilinia fructicola]